MVAEKSLFRDGTGTPSRGKNGPAPGFLDRNVNPDVSPDNIWEKRLPHQSRVGNRDRCTVKISCPACAAKYSIADEKVQDKLAKIRCRKCGTTIVIDGKVDPPSVSAGDGAASQVAVSDPAAASISAGEYSVDFGDNDQRTMTVPELVAAYNAGQLTAETFVWADGMADWQPVGQVPALVDALNAAAAPPAAPPPSNMINSSDIASPSPAPWEPKPAEVPSAARAAARVASSRGSTADLFGSSFETAGSEADVTTSAREPAPPAGSSSASAGGGGTGARNESSVLFSLSALTASAPVATPAAASMGGGGSTTATKEDSGLIDLKALTAASDAPAQHMAPLTPSPLGLAPLGLAPPLGGGVESQIAMPMAQPQKSKAGIFIGAGIAVAAIAIAAAIVVVGKGQPPPPAPTVAAQPAPTPTPTPAPTPTEESTAKAPATGTAEEDKKPPTAGGKKPAGGTAVAAKPGPGATKPAGGEKPAAGGETKPKPKPSGGCGCAPGDLQCAMKCAAGGK